MTQEEMFEKCFERPKNFYKLSYREQQKIDAKLGILAFDVVHLSLERQRRFTAYFECPDWTPEKISAMAKEVAEDNFLEKITKNLPKN